MLGHVFDVLRFRCTVKNYRAVVLSVGDDVAEEELCKICMEGSVDCVILECGHMCTCTQCGKQLSECPICRQYVLRVVHVFRA